MNNELWFNGPGDITTACCFDNMTNPNNYPPCSPGELQATSCGAIVDPIYDPIDDTPDGEIGTLDIRDTEPNVVGTETPPITGPTYSCQDPEALNYDPTGNPVFSNPSICEYEDEIDSEDIDAIVDAEEDEGNWYENIDPNLFPEGKPLGPPPPAPVVQGPNPAFKWLLIAGIGIILWRQFNK